MYPDVIDGDMVYPDLGDDVIYDYEIIDLTPTEEGDGEEDNEELMIDPPEELYLVDTPPINEDSQAKLDKMQKIIEAAADNIRILKKKICRTMCRNTR